MADVAARIAAWILAVTFVWAAAAKVVNGRSWRASLTDLRIPRRWVSAVAAGVPAAEVAAAALLLAVDARAGAALSIALVASFSLVLAEGARGGRRRLPCGCFGHSKERDLRVLLARNSALGALAAVVLVAGAPPAGRTLDRLEAGDAVPVIAIAVGVTVLLWMVRQVGAALARGRR